MKKDELAQIIDHTNLKQDATITDIEKLCKEAIDHNFYSVCVNPLYVKLASNIVQNEKTKVCSVVGFPLGANNSEVKLQEALHAVNDGADEIDLVAPISHIKNEDFKKVADEITLIRSNLPFNILLKVIVEAQNLTNIEIEKIVKILIDCDVQFIKTSTGFFGSVTTELVSFIKSIVSGKLQIKASGGIKTYTDCMSIIDAGADRIGCSASTSILHSLDKQ